MQEYSDMIYRRQLCAEKDAPQIKGFCKGWIVAI